MGEANRRKKDDPTWGTPAEDFGVVVSDQQWTFQGGMASPDGEPLPPPKPKLLSGKTWQKDTDVLGKVVTVGTTPWRLTRSRRGK